MRAVTNIYLDVDGVLNACSSSTPTDWAWPDEETTWIGGFPIRWSPRMIERLVGLAEQPSVQVYWLGSWLADAPRRLVPALGITGGQDWPVLGGDVNRFVPSWKLAVVRDHCGTNSVVWLDDDLQHSPASRDWASVRGTEAPTLTISPRTNLGLTPRDLDEVEGFVRTHEGNRDA